MRGQLRRLALSASRREMRFTLRSVGVRFIRRCTTLALVGCAPSDAGGGLDCELERERIARARGRKINPNGAAAERCTAGGLTARCVAALTFACTGAAARAARSPI